MSNERHVCVEVVFCNNNLEYRVRGVGAACIFVVSYVWAHRDDWAAAAQLQAESLTSMRISRPPKKRT